MRSSLEPTLEDGSRFGWGVGEALLLLVGESQHFEVAIQGLPGIKCMNLIKIGSQDFSWLPNINNILLGHNRKYLDSSYLYTFDLKKVWFYAEYLR